MATSTKTFLKKAFALFALVFFFDPHSAKILPPPPPPHTQNNTGHEAFVAFYIAGKQGARSPHRENKSCVGGLLSKPSNLSDAK
jgi:hypothetical protein